MTRRPGTRLVATLPETKVPEEWKLTCLSTGNRQFVIGLHPEHLPQMYEVVKGKVWTWELKMVEGDKMLPPTKHD